jgi:hypothetical protein
MSTQNDPPRCDVCETVTEQKANAYVCPSCGNSMGLGSPTDFSRASIPLPHQPACSIRDNVEKGYGLKTCPTCGLGPCTQGYVSINRMMLKIDPDSLSPVGKSYKHRFNGQSYRFVCIALNSDTKSGRHRLCVVYRSLSHPEERPWIMPIEEFCDGRFEVVE